MLTEQLQRLDDLLAKLAPARLEGSEPADEGQIDHLRASLAPMALPTEVADLYRWHNGGRFALFGMWSHQPIDRLLEGRDFFIQEFRQPPTLLSLFGDGQGNQLLVETGTTQEVAPGTLWELPHAEHLNRAYRSLEVLVMTVCTAIEAGIILFHDDPFRGNIDQQAFEDLRLQLNPGMVVSDTVSSWPDPDWPAAWLASMGISLHDYVPRGATATIAELIAAAENEPARGTVVGRMEYCGGSGPYMLLHVSDDSGSLMIELPERAALYTPDFGGRGEFDVEIPARQDRLRQLAALAGDRFESERRRRRGTWSAAGLAHRPVRAD